MEIVLEIPGFDHLFIHATGSCDDLLIFGIVHFSAFAVIVAHMFIQCVSAWRLLRFRFAEEMLYFSIELSESRRNLAPRCKFYFIAFFSRNLRWILMQ
jgi:hypothetical protein